MQANRLQSFGEAVPRSIAAATAPQNHALRHQASKHSHQGHRPSAHQRQRRLSALQGATKLLKLADLGVSHTPETLQQHTFTHLALQTWPYRAPEVLLQGKNCGFAADMWSVACVMFEIASKGKSLFPFSKSNSKEEDKNGLHDILLLRPEHSRSLTVIWDLFGIMISTPSAWPSNF